MKMEKKMNLKLSFKSFDSILKKKSEMNKERRKLIRPMNSENDETKSIISHDENDHENDYESETDEYDDEEGSSNRIYQLIKKEFDGMKRMMRRNELLFHEIFQKMDRMSNRMEEIEEKLQKIEMNQKVFYTEVEGEIIRIKELKPERIEISEDDVLRALIYKDYRSVIYIFKLYYKCQKGNRYFYPIRIKTKRNFEYFVNDQWVLDPFGHYSIKTICNNIQTLFLRYNQIENRNINQDDWYLNQEFIMKLSDDKYKKEVWKHIVEDILQHM